MATEVPTETEGVNGKADDSRNATLHPADVAAQKQPTLVQRLRAVVDAKIVESFNNWAELAGLSRQSLNKFLLRAAERPDRDMKHRSVTRLADAAGVKRDWLLAGTTLTPELTGGEAPIVRRLLSVIDLVLGEPLPGASASENDRAFAEAMASSEVMKSGDEDALALKAARAIHAAGRIDTKEGWAFVIDALTEYELVDRTAEGDRALKLQAARLRPKRAHEEPPTAIVEKPAPPVTPLLPPAPPPKKDETPKNVIPLTPPKKRTPRRRKKH